jgi:hypothetical protein
MRITLKDDCADGGREVDERFVDRCFLFALTTIREIDLGKKNNATDLCSVQNVFEHFQNFHTFLPVEVKRYLGSREESGPQYEKYSNTL